MRIATLAAAAVLAFVPAAGAVSPPPAEGTKGMVVTAQHLATEIGVDILKKGGNAVDAAVAVGYALAVVHPCCGNLGGGGFATIRLADGKDTFFNFREKAPATATADMFLDANGEVVPRLSLDGYKAVGVPGSVMGLDAMLTTYGTMTRADVMDPAIRLAKDGFVLAPGDVAILSRMTDAFAAEANVAAIFLPGGKPLSVGDRLVQADLAATLEAIRDGGPNAFYRGHAADAVAAASSANGGLLTVEDFAAYTVQEMEPVRCEYRGYGVISAPPPSSGGTTVCEILGIIEGYPLGELGYHSAAAVHLMVEAMRHAFVDRNFELGDPDFVDTPVERLTSDAHAQAIRDKIDPDKATPSTDVQPGQPPHEGTETTHYSVVDDAGNAVSVTYTINALFGAKVIAGDTGFFLNDEMDDFTTKPGAPNLFGLVQGAKNAIAPQKRPLSSMSPTILTKDGETAMVIGSPGGSRIITIVVQAIVNVVDFGMDVQAAIDAPRIHHQWLPDAIFAEPFALSPDTRKLLEGMGHTITDQPTWGAAEGIVVTPDTPDDADEEPQLQGANDNRRPAGAAMGL